MSNLATIIREKFLGGKLMNRKFKKVIALLMAVVMCLSVGFTAFAW